MSMPANTPGSATAAPGQARWGEDPDVEVLRLLAEGCNSAEIATRLGLRASAVKMRVERVYARIGCQNRKAQAAEHVARHGYELATTYTPALTTRESQVLDLIAQGHTNAELADTLGLSESTAKSHISTLYIKIGARNRAQATRYAMTLPNTAPVGVPAGA